LLSLSAAPKTIADQINTIPALAQTKNKSLARGDPQIVQFVTLALQSA
jgi:hypothetical protein